MARIVGEVALYVKSKSMSAEDIRALLQAIRDWEQQREVNIFVDVDAPGMTNEETKFIFDNITPAFTHQHFIPFEK